MKRTRGWKWRELHLDTILGGVVVVVFFLPVVLFMSWYFRSMKRDRLQYLMQDEGSFLKQEYSQIQKLVEMCSLSTEVVRNQKDLMEELDFLYQGNTMTVEQLLEFQEKDIAAIETLSITNPNIYDVRLYIDSETLAEMMPTLYRMERMKRMEWGKEELSHQSWYFDYEDRVFVEGVGNQNRHLAGLITPIENGREERIGYLEVAVRMEDLFPYIYREPQQYSGWFTDRGNRQHELSEGTLSLSEKERILEKIDFEKEEVQVFLDDQGGKLQIVSYLPVKELGGYYIRVSSAQEELQSIEAYQNRLLVLFGVILLTLLIILKKLIKRILKQFYLVLDNIRMVQMGDLSVQIPVGGISEMRELTCQINQMLVEINRLMKENIAREVLIKDTQLRALQNQINAHFIYNVLESIKMMAELERQYAISDSITVFGKLLRYGMKWGEKNVTVREEVEYCSHYLELVNMQSDCEIHLETDLEEEILAQEIPKMSLQPIMENAICHGLKDITEDTFIRMEGVCKQGECRLTITDPGQGMSREELERLEGKIAGEIETCGHSGNGIGLKNVQDRLHTCFGPGYGIRAESRQGVYTRIELTFPYQQREKRKESRDEKGNDSRG